MSNKTSKKKTTRIVGIPIYGGKLRIEILDHPAESKIWKEKFVCDSPSCRQKNRNPRTNFSGFAATYKEGIIIILQRSCGDKSCKNPFCGGLTPDTIAHEALHATYMILEGIGWKPDVRNHEPQTYLLGWIVRECFKAVAQDRKRNS